MSSATSSVWLGFTRMGGRFEVKLDDIKGGIAMLGQGANQLAPLVAYACHDAGLKALLLDIDGGVSDSLSGYMDEYDVSYFLYDSLRIEENPVVHAQLIAGAYSTSLELSFEQEASLNAIAQIIANERGVASPASLADLIQSPDSAKGRAVDRLRVRLEALRSLNLVGEKDAVKQILGRSAVLSFRNAGSPEASETAVALFLAKLLATMGGEERGPDVIILTEANRLFKERPVFRRNPRFLTAFVSAPLPKVLASDAAYGLDKEYMDTCSVRILSSAAWNGTGRGGLVLTPNMFMFQNPSYGSSEVFVPREFEGRKGDARTVASTVPTADEELAKRILEEIAGYQGATRTSLVSFLASEYDKDLLEKTFDRLQAEGYIAVTPQDRSGRTIHALSLTEKGRTLLSRAR
ncbi:MAG TPA: hypothetical protein VLU99_04725 [Nitrososphaerales archaeon]|nr:hypothetical protein [Nitrososphaerales archaeon]